MARELEEERKRNRKEKKRNRKRNRKERKRKERKRKGGLSGRLEKKEEEDNSWKMNGTI